MDDANSITMEDAKALRNHADRTSADRVENIIAAVENFASANEKAQAGKLYESPHVALSSTTTQTTQSRKAPVAHAASQVYIGLKTLRELATKVHAEIDTNPKSFTNEDLKLYQSVVSKLQRTAGVNTAGASHPELEELQQVIAKIEPKVESGTVTKEEGGVTAHAQNVAAKKARSVSISTAKETPTSSSNIQGHAGRFNPAEQSHEAKEVNFENVVAAIKPKFEKSSDMVTREDANFIHSREVRAHGATEKGGVVAQAMSLAAKNETA